MTEKKKIGIVGELERFFSTRKTRMSGHSKWAQIKRQKGAADAKRGTLYTKLSKVISAAAREGGKDPAMNVRLRLLIDKARSVNMPGATIERAIKRGAGDDGGGMIEQVTYECYGPGGVACIIEAVTDNKNRTTAEVRRVITKHGGRLGTTGNVLWMFETKGKIDVALPQLDEQTELALIDAGMEDAVPVEGGQLLYSAPERLEQLRSAAEKLGLTVKDPELVFVPKKETLVAVDRDEPLLALLADLDTLDDVTNVTTNAAGD